MKKITLLAAIAMAATAAQAQDNLYLEPIANAAANKYFDVIVLEEACVNKLTEAGKTVQACGPDNAGRNFWYWNGFDAGDASYPGIGWNEDNFNMDGYVSIDINGVGGWSGGGFNVRNLNPDTNEKYAGLNLKHINGETRFHIAYRTNSVAPVSTALILLDGEVYNEAGEKTSFDTPAKVAVGETAFDDNGKIFPLVGAAPSADWQAVDIAFKDIKKSYPAFDYEKQAVENWYGNIMSILGGSVAGTNICFDAVYFYTSDNSGVEGVAADDCDILYTGKTINASGANGISLYNLNGALVKSSSNSVLGTDGLAAGVYVAKAGNKAVKIVVK